MIKEINVIRLIFMLMIFVHHIDFNYNGGSTAVAAFFIIGGFCMTLGYGERVTAKEFQYIPYILKRSTKFYPLHWFVLFLFILLVQRHLIIDKKLIVNAMLLQAWVPRQEVFYSYNSPSWYCCNALFFTAIFPFLYRFLYFLKQEIRIVVITAVIMLNLVAYFVLPPDSWLSWLYVNPIVRISDCMVGIYTAFAYQTIISTNGGQLKYNVNSIDIAFWISLLFVISMSVILSFYSGHLRSIAPIYWIPECVLIISVAIRSRYSEMTLMTRFLNNPVLQALCKYAMSFYLLHSVVLNAYNWLPHPLFDYYQLWYIKTPIAFFTTIILSKITYSLIEIRFSKHLSSFIK